MRMGNPAGRPSTVTTNAGPWDSPAVRNRNTVPPGAAAPSRRRRHVGRVARFYGSARCAQPFCTAAVAGVVAPEGAVTLPAAPVAPAVAEDAPGWLKTRPVTCS